MQKEKQTLYLLKQITKSNSTNNTVGLQFDWKIFDGGSSKAYSKAKDAKINEIKEQVLFEKSSSEKKFSNFLRN